MTEQAWIKKKANLLLLMSLGTDTPWHRNVARIHTTTHPSLGSEIICCHALRLHPWHANHRHRPRSGSTWHYMGPRHAPRNRIPWWYLVKATKIWQQKSARKCTFTLKKQKIFLSQELSYARVMVCKYLSAFDVVHSFLVWQEIKDVDNSGAGSIQSNASCLRQDMQSRDTQNLGLHWVTYSSFHPLVTWSGQQLTALCMSRGQGVASRGRVE